MWKHVPFSQKQNERKNTSEEEKSKKIKEEILYWEIWKLENLIYILPKLLYLFLTNLWFEHDDLNKENVLKRKIDFVLYVCYMFSIK